MPTVAVIALLFVAAGLAVPAGIGIGRWRGSPPGPREASVMAAMTGVAVTFLYVVMPVLPLVVFPFMVAGMLVASWISGRQWRPLGAFLAGGGALLFTMQVLNRANDLADPAVVNPGWTPVPMALGAALAIFGTALVLAGSSEN